MLGFSLLLPRIRVVILGVQRLTGGRACPLRQARIGRACVKEKFIFPKLLYYGNFLYCSRRTWQRAV
jgi:hypothetical protein